MSDYIEIIFRWAFGWQMVFWGLNGFFNWVKIPPSGPGVERFVQACIEARFIMPVVKVIEIIFGVFLILGFVIPVSLVLFGPIIFVVTGLHLLHNPRPWSVIVPCTLPYILLLLFHSGSLLRLVH